MGTPERRINQDLNAEQLSILVADVEDYSTLEEFELRRFFKEVIEDIADALDTHGSRESNSWGDGVIAYFNDPRSAAECALDIRDLFRNTTWSSIGMSDVQVRIALHTATVFVGHNPIRESEGIVGTDVTLTARVEPVVTPNHIFTTSRFKQSLNSQVNDKNIAFDKLYETELAKGWGEETLYSLRRTRENEITPDDVAEPSSSEPQGDGSRVKALNETFLEGKAADADEQIRTVDILALEGTVEAIPVLTDALRDEENVRADVRGKIAHELSEFNDDRVIPYLVEAINEDESDTVVHYAVGSLGDLGNIEALDTLENVLKGRDKYADNIRYTAALSLADLEDIQAIPALSDVLDDETDSEDVRSAAVQALKNLEDTKTTSALISALNAPEENVRGIAIEALGSLGGKEAIDDLQTLVEDTSGTKKDIRKAAVSALKEIGEPEVSEPLTTALDDPSPEVQSRAINGLGAIGANGKLKELENRLLSEEFTEQNRAAAATALGSMANPASAESLLDAAQNDISIDVRKVAVSALGELQSITCIDEIAELATDREGTVADVRDQAAFALGEMGHIEAMDALVEAMDDPVVEVQRSAIEAAASIGGESAIQELTRIIDESDEYPGAVRAMAATHVRYFDRDPRVINVLERTLQEDENTRVRRSAGTVLGRVGDANVVDTLEETLSDKSNDNDIRFSVTWSLGLISHPSCEETLFKTIQDDSEPWKVQNTAVKALRCLGTASSKEKLSKIAGSDDVSRKVQFAARDAVNSSPSEIKDKMKQQLDDGEW